MEELRYNDLDYSPESREQANCRSTEETRAPQPKTQSNPLGDHSEDSILIGERKWNDSLAYEKFKGYTLEPSISKLVMRLVRLLDQKDGETDGAVHLKSMGPKLRHAFREQGGQPFRILIRLNVSGKEAVKPDSNVARTPTTFNCTFAPYMGTLEET